MPDPSLRHVAGAIEVQGLKSSFCACCGAQIEADIECDTFFPELRRDRWRLWSAAPPRRDGGMRYAFHCYVPAGPSSSSNGSSGSDATPCLPPALAARHEEYQVCSPSLLAILRHGLAHVTEGLMAAGLSAERSQGSCFAMQRRPLMHAAQRVCSRESVHSVVLCYIKLVFRYSECGRAVSGAGG